MDSVPGTEQAGQVKKVPALSALIVGAKGLKTTHNQISHGGWGAVGQLSMGT